jgi:hypothetical protein
VIKVLRVLKVTHRRDLRDHKVIHQKDRRDLRVTHQLDLKVIKELKEPVVEQEVPEIQHKVE